MVFTVPKRLRIFFRFDRKLLGELPGCAWRALRLYFAAWFDGEEVVPGAVGFVQTAGELLGWHPHLHLLLTDGIWLPDGTFRHLLAFDSSAVEKLFRAEVLRLLVARGKISEEVVENLLTWRHSGFSVHAGVRVEERSEAVRLGRYGIRCPLVLERLAWDENSARSSTAPDPGTTMAGESRLHAGMSSNSWPGCSITCRIRASSSCATGAGTATRLEAAGCASSRASQAPHPRAVTDLQDPHDAEGRQRRLTWSQLIRKVYEIDPLLCPYCGATMRIVAFLIDFASLRRILGHLGFAPQQPEPLAHAPPDETELYVSNA